MNAEAQKPADREYDFALIVDGVGELTQAVEDALHEAGCDDATISLQFGLLYLEFSRSAASLQEAIVSAIHDVQRAKVGGHVRRVDDCDVVSAADIARRIGRSRQLVHQYMTGQRGPGDFPPPEFHLTDGKPLWTWCAVSAWLAANDLLRAEVSSEAEVIAVINTLLESQRQKRRYPKLSRELKRQLQGA